MANLNTSVAFSLAAAYPSRRTSHTPATNSKQVRVITLRASIFLFTNEYNHHVVRGPTGCSRLYSSGYQLEMEASKVVVPIVNHGRVLLREKNSPRKEDEVIGDQGVPVIRTTG
jgi:hypothetical protein